MSYGLKLLVPCALALYLASACQPDLDSLSAEYSATAGSSSSDGGGNNNGGATSSCTNDAKDTNESDVDCGGASKCDRCAETAKCSASSDCQASLYCATSGSTKRCKAPTCDDQIKNGDETGEDCGGDCDACDLDAPCDEDKDCSGKYCLDGFCADHCTSGKTEADETGPDCGGSCAAGCGNGLTCKAADDCQSGVCFNEKCQAPSCNDSIKNQDESFDDCGGVCSAMGKACDLGITCNRAEDCESYICSPTTRKCLPDIVVAPIGIVDDFEDGDFYLPKNPALQGRVGNWYAYGDGTGIATEDIVDINRGTSVKGIQTTGKEFTKWGSGVGVDLKNSGSSQATKLPFDAAAYSALTFWGRAEKAITVAVVLPDVNTDPSGKRCNPDPAVSGCDHHFSKSVQITTSWQRFTVAFSELMPESGNKPLDPSMPLNDKFAPGPAPDGVVSVQFRVQGGQTYDLFLDDIAFVKLD